MGQPLSKDKLLLDCSFHQMPFSLRTTPACSCWDHTKAKNYDYYFKRPTTHISRSRYRWYERGYLWGYYNIPIKYGRTRKKKTIRLKLYKPKLPEPSKSYYLLNKDKKKCFTNKKIIERNNFILYCAKRREELKDECLISFN